MTITSRNNETEQSGKKLPQYAAGLSSSLGALASGMVMGWSSPAGLYLAEEYKLKISPSEFTLIASIFNLGAATICLPIGILADFIGRKRAMLMLTVTFTIGWALIIWANSVTMLVIGRYILGVSGGAFCVTTPMYTAEIAEVSIRGRLGSYYELMLCIGIVIPYILGATVSMFTLSLICATVPLLFFGIFVFMPESPTYFLLKGNVFEASKSYRWLRGPNYNIKPELDATKNALAEAKRNRVSFFVAISSRATLKGLFIAFGLMFFQQMNGINAILFYADSIFKKAESNVDSDLSSIIMGLLQVVAVFISSLIVDRLGRRILLMMSAFIMGISLLVLGIYFHLQINGMDVSTIGWLPLVTICLFVSLISIGFGPIPWMMTGELFAPQVKGIAGSSASLFNWIAAFVVTKFYNDFVNVFGVDITFWIFSLICGLAVIFVFLFVPETKGKTLEEIQIELSGKTINSTGFIITDKK